MKNSSDTTKQNPHVIEEEDSTQSNEEQELLQLQEELRDLKERHVNYTESAFDLDLREIYRGCPACQSKIFPGSCTACEKAIENAWYWFGKSLEQLERMGELQERIAQLQRRLQEPKDPQE